MIRTAAILLLISLLAVSCTTARHSVPTDAARTHSPPTRALSWLAKQQGADGFWGTRQHRVALTSLATLAFLAHGETPASSEYGSTVEDALRALLTLTETNATLTIEEQALLTWCFADAYGITRVPLFLDPIQKYLRAFRPETATSWHARASFAAFWSEADPDTGKRMLASLVADYPMLTNDVLNQATHLFLAMRDHKRDLVPVFTNTVLCLSPEKWKEVRSPLQSAVMLDTVLYDVGGQTWGQWSRVFQPDIYRRQQGTPDGLGWWTPESFEIRDLSEVHDMSKKEANVYTTSLILMTLPFRRGGHPRFRRPEDDKRIPHEDEPIHIIIRGI